MKIFNIVLKVIIVFIFVTIIGTLFSIGLSPKDKALENQSNKFTKFVELHEDQYETLYANGISLSIDDEIMNVRLEEFGIKLIDDTTGIEKFFLNILGKPKKYELIIEDNVFKNTVQFINKKFESNTIPQINMKDNQWLISPMINDRFVDQNELLNEILKSFENNNFHINIKTIPKPSELYAPSQDYLDSIKLNLTKPIYIEINDFGEIKKYQLNDLEIFQLLTSSISNNFVDVSINQILLNNLIYEKLKDIPRNQELKIKRKKVLGNDTSLDIDSISKQAYEIIKTRMSRSDKTDKIVSNTKYAPFTNGDKFEKYIEVDLSQKMLYAWENGNLKYEMLVSTGFNNTTPKGEYQIQNKADNPFSDIDNSYMPFWMSFHKDSRFDAWLGFHALTHKINSKGKYIYEPETNLGGTTSGGCVKLGRKEAEILYNWAEVGDKVYIHD